MSVPPPPLKRTKTKKQWRIKGKDWGEWTKEEKRVKTKKEEEKGRKEGNRSIKEGKYPYFPPCIT